MATFKCKMCGAPLDVNNGQTVATCEFCGSKQTVANADDERKENLFNRANSLRMNCEFDKAILSYQSILATFPKEPEAHWGLCLCRYGIEYVDDPKTKSKKPTIHRMSYESILNDSDYLGALENADVIAKEEYQAEAKAIADIQKNILSISQKEDPFDVFICYKETDENGKRTRDSVLAQEIYSQLTNKGYKVFFARITLENKLGTMYEPYIFAALNSAKIMLVLGTKKEYFEAIWVKNEWQRFIDMMQTRPDRYLIPCYKDMDAYEMPEQFLSFQGQDMAKLGFMQDLIRGIDKIMGRNEKPKETAQTVTNTTQNGVNLSSRLKRAEILIGDKNYQKAWSLLDEVLNNDPTNSMAYLLCAVMDLELTSIDDLKDVESVEYYEELPNYEKAYKFANEEEKKRLDEIKEHIERRNEEEYLSGLYKQAMDLKDAGKYDEAYKAFSGIVAYKTYKDSSEQSAECLNIINDGIYKNALELKENKEYDQAIETFGKIADFKDSESQISECEELKNLEVYNQAMALKNDGEFDKASAIFENISEYSDSAFQIEECKRLKEDVRKEMIYAPCLFEGKIKPHRDEHKLKVSCEALSTIPGYKDSDQLLERYESILREYSVKKKRTIKITALISASTAVVFTGIMMLTFLYIVPQTRQSNIETCIDQGKYQEASALLEQNGNFGDSNNLRKMCEAGKLFEDKRYEDAISHINDIKGTVTVSYDSNGGNVSKSQETIKQISFINNDPSKDGYAFYGWEQTTYTINSKSHSATLSLLANYSPIAYSLTFDLNGGTTSEKLPSEYTIEDSLAFPNPTRKGYAFIGWSGSNGDKPVTDYTLSKGNVGNKTYKANWSANAYTLTFNTNGADVSYASETIYYDQAYKLPTPTRKGYTFVGWYDGSKNIPTTGTWTIDSDKTLTARWKAIEYSITYTLNGGANSVRNPNTYTIEDSVKLDSPVKNGYTFEGWYANADFTGDKATEIAKGTTGDMALYAKWNLTEYSITYELNGGVNSADNPSSYNILGENIVLASPTKDHYSFSGWYLDPEFADKIVEVPSGSYGDLILYARWEAITYSITYDLNGGVNSPANPSTYTVEDEIELASPDKVGYTFAGWYHGGTNMTIIPKGTFGNISLGAKWSANLNTLSVTSEDEAKGTVEIVSGEGYTDEAITVKATPSNGFSFAGWYEEETRVCLTSEYTFAMPAGDKALVAKFADTGEYLGRTPAFNSETNTITYGLYPQTHVNDEALISSLDELTTTESNGWYLYDGTYYAKKKAEQYFSSYTFSDGTKIVKGTEYWFRCEPIEWKILLSSNGIYSLVSSVLLDTHVYRSSLSNRTIGGKTVYPNNYEYSDIRSWLNGKFFSSAFALGRSLIQTVTVYNSASTTDSSENEFICSNTNDKVYLLSYNDYRRSFYFPDSESRCCKPTDWAKANDACCSSGGSYDGNGWYYTRSPSSLDSQCAEAVRYNGILGQTGVSHTNYCVRPAITIKDA